MSKTNQFIKILGISSSILIINTGFATADKVPSLENGEKLENSAESVTNNPKNSSFSSKLPISVKSNLESSQLSNSDSVFEELISGKIAQTSETTPDATTDIIKPAQEAIPSTEKLNPSSNSLSLPTKPDEVKVGDQKPITLEQAIKLAFKNNKDIEEAKIQVERSQDVLKEQQAARFPTLDLGSALNFNDAAFLDGNTAQLVDILVEQGATQEEAEDSIGGISGSFTDRSLTFNSDLTLNYTIFDSGNRKANIRTAEKQLRTTELDLEVISEQTRLDTASDYYDLQDSDAQVKIEDAAVEDAQQTLKDAQLLEKAGLGTRFDVLRAEVELAQAQQRLSTAIANQNIARRQLAETLSVDHESDLSTADAIEEAGNWELSLTESIVKAFKNRAELGQLLLQKEIGEEQRTIALSQNRPAIAASAQYQVSDDFEGDELDLTDNYTLGLNLQWQLFDGGAARAGARQAEKDIELAETQFGDQRNEIRFAVEQAFFGLESNRDNIGTASKEVDLAEESLRLARLRFQAGVGTQTDVIEAQTQLTTARGNLLSSIIDYNQSYTQLQRQVSQVTGIPSVNNNLESLESESVDLENDSSENDDSENNSEESDELEFNSDDLDSNTPESN